MIEFSTRGGKKVILNTKFLVAIEEAVPSLKLHGIHSHVICQIGGEKILYESTETPDEIYKRMIWAPGEK